MRIHGSHTKAMMKAMKSLSSSNPSPNPNSKSHDDFFRVGITKHDAVVLNIENNGQQTYSDSSMLTQSFIIFPACRTAANKALLKGNERFLDKKHMKYVSGIRKIMRTIVQKPRGYAIRERY